MFVPVHPAYPKLTLYPVLDPKSDLLMSTVNIYIHDSLRNGKVPVRLKQHGGEDEAGNLYNALVADEHWG